LVKKINLAYDEYLPKSVAICGGVVANTYIREEIKKEFPELRMPKLRYANDNAAMIGAAAYIKYCKSDFTIVTEIDIKLGGIG
jgi:N6-L-threonylcarbamoyladenine synthase